MALTCRGRVESLRGKTMKNDPKTQFSPLCDLHHCPMRRVMLEEPGAQDTQTHHQCERRDCNRIFRGGYGYSDFSDGQFDGSRVSSRECPRCGGILYLAEVDRAQKVETWECTENTCNYTEDASSPSSR